MRREELDMAKLQYWGLVSRYFIKTTDLTRADLELLVYLNPIPLFTIHDFKTGQLLYSWDVNRFYRLKREGWIDLVHDGKGRTGGHSKYATSTKTKRLVKRIGRILDGKENLPETIIKKDGFMDNMYLQAIRKFNKREHS